MDLFDELFKKNTKLSVIGVGYVGLPLAIAFSKHFEVIGYDKNNKRICKLKNGIDITMQANREKLSNINLVFTNDEESLSEAKFHIIAVPTPIYKDKTPNIEPLVEASETVGKYLSRDSIIVYESTVYPGLVEEVCIPILEEVSGLRCSVDFKVGYSPERINPGDSRHTLSNTVKIVSAIDEEALETVYKVYQTIIEAGVYKVSSIKAAEAAKIIENCQRDVNIAFMNEMSILLNKLQLDTKEVLEAAGTKWNFIKHTPGLVGGHCIAVDPYYLIELSKTLGYTPKILISSRSINEYMPQYIADKLAVMMMKYGKVIENSNIIIMGITFKENCPDIRNSKVIDLLEILKSLKANTFVYDPVANSQEVMNEYGVELVDFNQLKELDAVIVAVAHNEFCDLSLDVLNKLYKKDTPRILIDVKGIYNKEYATQLGYEYWRL